MGLTNLSSSVWKVFFKTMKSLNFIQSQWDHILFAKYFVNGKITTLIVYIDDIVVTGDDLEEIGKLKEKLKKEFQIKDLERFKYFLSIKVAQLNEGIVISQ